MDSLISLLNSYFDLNVDVVEAATGNRYVEGNENTWVNFGPVALFSNYKLPTSSGKLLENINHDHIVSSMCKLTPRSRRSDELSLGFDWDRGRRQRELTNNKNLQGKYHVEFMLRDIFGFPKHQNKATAGFGYKFVLRWNSGNSVLNKENATNLGNININGTEWHLPQYTPSIPQQAILSEQISSRVPTELQYVEGCVSGKKWILKIYGTSN